MDTGFVESSNGFRPSSLYSKPGKHITCSEVAKKKKSLSCLWSVVLNLLQDAALSVAIPEDKLIHRD